MKGLCRLGVVILLAMIFGALPFTAAADNASCGVKNTTEPLWMTRPSGGGVSAQAFCSAACMWNTQPLTASCSTCSATDMECPFTRGSVTCNSVLTPCPDACPDGDYCLYVNGTTCSPGTRECLGSRLQVDTCDCFRGSWSCPY
jgi:hypothetical protein